MNGWGPYGRVRLDEEMAGELLATLNANLAALWKIRASLPNPSDEGLATIRRIRRLEKIRRNVIGTMEEKGWSERVPPMPTLSGGAGSPAAGGSHEPAQTSGEATQAIRGREDRAKETAISRLEGKGP